MQGRLAVECDGDQWHGIDRHEYDSARQRDLERAGWQFVHIRGGDFYRDPEKATEPLWGELQRLGISPGGIDVSAAAPPEPEGSTDTAISTLPIEQEEPSTDESDEPDTNATAVAVTPMDEGDEDEETAGTVSLAPAPATAVAEKRTEAGAAVPAPASDRPARTNIAPGAQELLWGGEEIEPSTPSEQ